MGLPPVPGPLAWRPGQMVLPTPGGGGPGRAPQATDHRPTSPSPGYHPPTSRAQGDKLFRRGTPPMAPQGARAGF